jgi:hypothetical protein
MEVVYEIIGYAGTAFVLLSMMMTSVKKLRIFNMCGAVLSAFYAVMTGAMPVFVLNLCLTAINGIQLYRLKNKKEEVK